MRLPNGYGSVIDLGKKRRNRYAVRVTKDRKLNSQGKCVLSYRYLGYFPTSKEAYGFLAKYNSGEPIKEHIPLIKKPTFKDLYEEWYEYKHNMNKKPSKSSSQAYKYGFNMCAELHEKKFANIKIEELQFLVDKHKQMSKATVSTIKTILFALYEYAMKREVIEKDYSKLVDYEWSSEKRINHATFTEDELKILWNNISVEYVDWVLIMIYTGLRVSEICDIRTENVFLDDLYMIGGKKTASGKNRVMPIHQKIVPLIRNLYNSDNEFLIYSKNNKPMNYKTFLEYWTELMATLELNHLPHDTRYTTATLLDRYGANKVCIKKILGHTIQDITDGVYTQKELPDLLEAISVIAV